MRTTELTDAELVQRFEDMTLPSELFTHRQHVRAAWLFVRRYGMPGAMSEFSRALRQFAIAKGAPRLYHVTITWAYLLLISERQAGCSAADFTSFATQNQDLLRWSPSILDNYYTSDTLWSDRARHTFVMPDRMLSRDTVPREVSAQRPL